MSIGNQTVYKDRSLVSPDAIIVTMIQQDVTNAIAARIARNAVWPNADWPAEINITHTDPIAFALRRITGEDVFVSFVYAEIGGRRYALGDAALANVRAWDEGDRKMPFMVFVLRAVQS